MSLPLVILAIFSIFFGYITKDIFIGLGSDFFSDNSIIYTSYTWNYVRYRICSTYFIINYYLYFLQLSLTIFSILFTEFYPKLLIKFKLSRLGYNIFSFFNQRFLVEMFYNKYISGTVLKLRRTNY